MPSLIRQPDGVTHKQRVFIKEIVSGKNGTEAALVAYDTTDKNTAHAIASENLQKPAIREAIQNALETNGLGLATIVGNLNQAASAKVEKVSADSMIKANVEILKLMGAYPDRKSAHLNINVNAKIKDMGFDEAKKELDRLNSGTNEFIEEAQ